MPRSFAVIGPCGHWAFSGLGPIATPPVKPYPSAGLGWATPNRPNAHWSADFLPPSTSAETTVLAAIEALDRRPAAVLRSG